jgi:hypothetical protein
MENLYRTHINELEKFAKDVNLSREQKLTLCSVTKNLVDDVFLVYTLALAKDLRRPPYIEEQLKKAFEEYSEISKALGQIWEDISQNS